MLSEVLKHNAKAAAFYASLHPSIRRIVDRHADEIVLEEDLYAVANNTMTDALREFGGIYDDSDTWPD